MATMKSPDNSMLWQWWQADADRIPCRSVAALSAASRGLNETVERKRVLCARAAATARTLCAHYRTQISMLRQEMVHGEIQDRADGNALKAEIAAQRNLAAEYPRRLTAFFVFNAFIRYRDGQTGEMRAFSLVMEHDVNDPDEGNVVITAAPPDMPADAVGTRGWTGVSRILTDYIVHLGATAVQASARPVRITRLLEYGHDRSTLVFSELNDGQYLAFLIYDLIWNTIKNIEVDADEVFNDVVRLPVECNLRDGTPELLSFEVQHDEETDSFLIVLYEGLDIGEEFVGEFYDPYELGDRLQTAFERAGITGPSIPEFDPNDIRIEAGEEGDAYDRGTVIFTIIPNYDSEDESETEEGE